MPNKIHLIGYAHLDPVWLWRWQDGFAEIKATFQSALDRMNEFPDFIFSYPCASYYEWVEENAPEMFEEITKRVKEGRWKITGGMWIQPDCNIPSGESFARHFLISQRYFKEKFGLMASTGYNADSFGHNASMPKLLKAAGIDNYVMMRPDKNENPNIPELAFRWESNDGSRVLTYKIAHGYGSNIYGYKGFEREYEVEKAVSIVETADTTNLPVMYFYGVGNHGGGPTIKSLRTLENLRSKPGGERFIYSSPDEYFSEIGSIPDLPIWKGDLQHHASLCYSANSEIKYNNRRSENRLISAEKFAVLSNALTGYIMPQARMDKAWKNVLFNQFHDIAAGCSIQEAYEDAREVHGEALNIAAEVQNAAVQKISWAIDTSVDGEDIRDKTADWQYWGSEELGTPVIVFNPLAWDRKIPARVNKSVHRITDENGTDVLFQKTRAARTDQSTGKMDVIFTADVPAMGWRLYRVYFGNGEEIYFDDKPVLENAFLRLEIDLESGYIKSLFDKENNREVFCESAAVPLLIDVEHADTWGHGLFSFRDVTGRFHDAKISILESGPVRSVLRVESRFNTSLLCQDFILYEGSRQVEVNVKLDWREKHKLLKLSFPVNIEGEVEVVYDVPFGHIQRHADGLEESGQMWLDISGGKYGTALLNDGKYAFDVLNNDMRMTVANGSMYADHYGQEIRDNINEFLDQGIQFFKYALLPHKGNWRTAGVVKAAIALNTETVQIAETYHKSSLPRFYKGIEVSADNIIITAVKQAAGSDGIIIRAYESNGIDTECEIRLIFLDKEIKTQFTKYAVKTFKICGDTITQCNLIEDVTGV